LQACPPVTQDGVREKRWSETAALPRAHAQESAVTLTRRALCALPLVLPALRAAAQPAFPDKPVRIVVPFPPGGATDSAARVLADALAPRYGRPVVVENRPGAGGTIGAENVARGAADGHSWLLGSPGNLAIAPFLYPNLGFDPARDLAPVSLVFTTDHVLTVNPSMPVRTVPEFIAHARAQPRPLSFGSSGNGSSLQLIGELFRLRAGIELVHVPYRGSAPAVADLMAGNIDCMFDQLPASMAQIQAGRLRALATTGPARHASLPQVPTVGETIPGYEAQSWNGMAVAAGTPPALVARISADINAALAEPAVQARLAPLGADFRGTTPEAMGALMRAEAERWGPVIREARITAT
jgi:tripartite-type tricarboxylate transporter receptor subunit TctC